jgi:cobalamin biosynthesis Mg chelatase CobN
MKTLMERVREIRRRMETGTEKARVSSRTERERQCKKDTPPPIATPTQQSVGRTGKGMGAKGVLVTAGRDVTLLESGHDHGGGNEWISNGTQVERVYSPASETDHSSSSSLMTHSTHTAVPTPTVGVGSRTGTVREEMSISESERTVTGRERRVGSLVYVLREQRRWIVIIMLMGLMGMYYQTRGVRRKRGRGVFDWIWQSLVDFTLSL